MWLTVIGPVSPDTNDFVGADRVFSQESVAASQVLVGVVVVLAVRRELQERQLLVAAL